MKKLRFIGLIVLFVLLLCFIPVYANDSVEEFEQSITQDLSELLPQEILQELPESILQGEAVYDTSFLFRAAGRVIRSCMGDVIADFAALLGLMLIASALTAMRGTFFSDKIGQAFSFLSLLCSAVAVYQTVESLWSECGNCLDSIVSFGNGLIPILAALLTAGGNATAAAVSTSGLTASLAAVGNLSAKLLFPMLRIGFAFALLASVSGEISLDGLGGLIRRMCTTVLAVAMTAFSTVLAFQTRLAASTDSVGARVLRFAIGTIVPMVGGAVNEAVHAVAGSLGYLRTFVGTVSIFALVLLLLPVLIRLFLYKIAFSLGATIGGVLGCSGESKLLGEIRDLMNFAIALLFFSASVLLVYLTVFMKTASALSAA